MVAHGIRLARADLAIRVDAGFACLAPRSLLLADESVHLAPVYIRFRARFAVRPALVPVVRIMIRLHALSGFRIGDAYREIPVLHREAVGPGVCAEIFVEGA